ncbi:MAG: family 16 glycoside hydrolase [Chloroflexota bacterium]
MDKMQRFFVGVFVLLLLAGCTGSDEPYLETFDEVGNWRSESDGETAGFVENGAYKLSVASDVQLVWTTAGEEFGNGRYSVEATQLAGPLDNGYGMLIRVDDESDNFYAFEISGDGFAWVGRYANGAEDAPIIGQWWFEAPAVNQGLNVTNTLAIRAEAGNLIFFVNDQEVGRVTDNTYSRGDIGLMVETLGQGGVEVQFDNFRVDPLE